MDGDICEANASRCCAREIAFSASEAPTTESKAHGCAFDETAANKKPGLGRVFIGEEILKFFSRPCWRAVTLGNSSHALVVELLNALTFVSFSSVDIAF